MIYLQKEDAVQFQTENTAIALGKFDGIHIGHQLLLQGLFEEQKKGRKALVFTFGENPGVVLHGENKKFIYTPEERAAYFDALGVDILLEYPFSSGFASFSPEEFVKQCLVEKLGVQSIYVGEDFCFGKGRSGNVATLTQLGNTYGFTVHAIKKKKIRDREVSSTIIRELIEQDLSLANEMLGSPYYVYGEVVHGKHLGHSIGFPTINQKLNENKVIPALGVYASRVWIEGSCYRAISNLGKKPTVGTEYEIGLETHIFDFSDDLYGRKIRTELLYFVRPERKFDDLEALQQQIIRDADCIKRGGRLCQEKQ